MIKRESSAEAAVPETNAKEEDKMHHQHTVEEKQNVKSWDDTEADEALFHVRNIVNRYVRISTSLSVCDADQDVLYLDITPILPDRIHCDIRIA